MLLFYITSRIILLQYLESLVNIVEEANEEVGTVFLLSIIFFHIFNNNTIEVLLQVNEPYLSENVFDNQKQQKG